MIRCRWRVCGVAKSISASSVISTQSAITRREAAKSSIFQSQSKFQSKFQFQSQCESQSIDISKLRLYSSNQIRSVSYYLSAPSKSDLPSKSKFPSTFPSAFPFLSTSVITNNYNYNRQSLRNYVFFPSSISEITKSLKETIQKIKTAKKKDGRRTIENPRRSRQKFLTPHPHTTIKTRYALTVRSSRNRYRRTKSRFVEWRRSQAERFMVERAVLERRSRVLFRRFRKVGRDAGASLIGRLPIELQGMRGRYGRYRKRRSAIVSTNTTGNLFPFSRHDITITEPYFKEWFSIDGYPLTSRDPRTGRFVNPWKSESTNGWKTFGDVWRWKSKRFFGLNHDEDQHEQHQQDGISTEISDEQCVHSAPREETITPPSTPDRLKLTWIGHATSLVQISNLFTVLTDPVFSHKASPLQILPNTELLGVPRRQPPSISLTDGNLTPDGRPVDVCLISHDHYDHLDLGSVKKLLHRNLIRFWVVPTGLKRWLIEAGVPENTITELQWWEDIRFTRHGNDGDLLRTTHPRGKTHTSNPHTTLHSMIITCAPAQHWCSRNPFDRNRRLWCSWAIHATAATTPPAPPHTPAPSPGQSFRFYYAGDTGYPRTFPLHRQIGDRLGPFHLAALPIGAYRPRFFMEDSHCDPAEAVEIHRDVRAGRSVAVHWGTFALADEPMMEPPRLLKGEVEGLRGRLG